MLTSLRSRLWLLLLAFLLLVLGSVAVTMHAAAGQRHDAFVINLAGRQRMLSQQMTWLALRAPDDPAADAAHARFVQTLTALRNGGVVPDAAGRPVMLPRIADADVQAGLEEAWQIWQRFDQLRTAVPAQQAALTATSLDLLAALDRVVEHLSQLAQAQVQRLAVVQAIFLLLALALLGWGYWFIRGGVVAPLATLGASARRMAAGDLTPRVPDFAEDELRGLAQALEAMRVEVLASRSMLEARVDRRTRELAAAFEFSQEITAQLELEHLLESVTDRARTLMGGRAAALCILDEADGMLHLAAGSGEGEVNPLLRQPPTRELSHLVIGEGRTVQAEAACSGCAFLRNLPDSQCVATPLRAGEHILGALCVARPTQAGFEAEEQAAFALLANAAAVAITNARLVEAGRAQAEQSAIQTERARLAAELHDNLAQTLSFLNFKTDRLSELVAGGRREEAEQELARMRGATTRAYGQVRAALTGLRMPEPETDAFAHRLADCVAELRAASGLPIDLKLSAPAALELPAVAQAQVLHIVREAITNVWRHARARQVAVHVTQQDGTACYTVVDDGCGFDPAAVDSTVHMGLTIMRARAERSGGTLTVETQPGRGTTVEARFALARTQEQP